MAHRLPGTLLAGLAACWILAQPVLAADDEQQRIASTFEEAVDAIEVQVPVTVLDREGAPVRSLGVEDFELLDRGRRQEIVGFQMIDLDTIEPARSRLEIDRAVPAAARRYFLLLFDFSFSQPAAMVRARQAARQFVVASLHPSDLAAVAVLTPETGPRLLVSFTPDRAQLARAIDLVGGPELPHLAGSRDPLGLSSDRPSAAEQGWQPVERSKASDSAKDTSAVVQSYLDVINQRMSSVERSFDRGRIESWTGAMQQLARGLDSLRGRKYVVYFAEGFDSQLLSGRPLSTLGTVGGRQLTAIERNQQGVLDTEDLYGSGQLQATIDRMLQEYRRADCVIQVIDVAGLGRASGEGDANLAARDSLFYLADRTGGELYQNDNDLDTQLQAMLRRTAVTYLLSFRPHRVKADGSYHRLRVKATIPEGGRLTHRDGYYAPRPFEELDPLEKDLLIADAIAGARPSRDVTFEVLAAPFRARESRSYVPVVLEVPGEDLLVDHGSEHLPIEIYAYVADESGMMQDFFAHVLTFNLAGRREAFSRSGLKYYGHLDLGEGEDYLLRVVVRNGQTGRTGVETVALRVPRYASREPILLPPFFVEAAPSWFMVREEPPAEEADDWRVYPFTLRGDPFVPAVRPRLGPGEEIDLCLIAYNLGVEDVTLSGRILGPEGTELLAGGIDLRERIVATRDGVDKLVARFRPAGLGPGSYRLEIDLRDPSWGRTVVQGASFEIVGAP